MTRLFAAALCVFALTTPACANDGFGGLSATGLTFGHTEAVAMLEEDLRIGPDRISVDYVFQNITDQDVTGEVIFPLPPISILDLYYSSWNLPEDRDRENLVDFQALVDGERIAVVVDRLAVIAPENAWDLPAAAAYDTPGRDVTAQLNQFGLSLSLDAEAVMAQIGGMTLAQRKVLLRQGLVESADGSDDVSDVTPTWSIVLRYHWPQVFPAGAVVRVHHEYENRPSGGIFEWRHPPDQDYLQDAARHYCIDAGTSRAMAKALAHKMDDGTVSQFGTSLNIEYVLRTANSWAGPIGHFRLTLDKGSTKNVISLCADGVKKTGPTTFEVEKRDYVPDRDLAILIARPYDD